MDEGDRLTTPPREEGEPIPDGKVYRGAATAIALAWSLRAIGLVSVLVLARVLTPQDFGIVALATSVLALVDIFSALGLRQSLLRIRKPEAAHYDTAWSIQLTILVVLAVLLVLISPLAAAFYDEPTLTLLISVLAVTFVIDGLSSIRVVDFERHLEFGRDMRMRLTVRLTTFTLTLTLALVLQNYWALVLGMLAQSTLNAIASYWFFPIRPRFTYSKHRELLGVSLWMFLASAAQTIDNQIEKLVVGRVATRGILGSYAVSKDLASIFTEEIATALNRVTFVTTAQTGRSLSADPDRLPAMLGAYALIAAPLGLGLAATAEYAIPLILGAQWTSAAPLLALIAPAYAMYAVYRLVISTLQASGDAKYAGFLSIGGTGLLIAAIVGAASIGYTASGIATVALAATGLVLFANIVLLARKASIGALALLLAVIRPFAAATAMLIALGSLDLPETSPISALIVMVPTGAALYAVVVAALWLLQGRPKGAEGIAVNLAKDLLARRAGNPTRSL